MKRILTITIVLALLGTSFAAAQVEVDSYPSVDILQEDELTQYPTIDASDIATWEGLINDNLESQMDVAKDAANAALGALPDLSGLAGAFADAGVFASNVATLRSYTDYQSFYLAAGTNVGAQLPSGDLSSEEG
ncbi:MAG: hypothetical protein ACOCYC_01040, partial [bacterium]